MSLSRKEKTAIAVTMLFPLSLLIHTFFKSWIDPYFPSWLLIPGSFVILIVFKVLQDSSEEKKAGLKPAKRGLSAQLDVYAKKMKEQADAVENAVRFQSDVSGLGVPFERKLKDTLKQIERQDKVELISYIQPVLQNEDQLMDDLMDFQDRLEEDSSAKAPQGLQDRLNQHAETLRRAAKDLEEYAEMVRTRGGIYHQSGSQIKGCAFYLVLYTAAGIYAIYSSSRERDWIYWAGWCVVVSDLFFAVMLYRMQTDPP